MNAQLKTYAYVQARSIERPDGRPIRKDDRQYQNGERSLAWQRHIENVEYLLTRFGRRNWNLYVSIPRKSRGL